MAFSLVPRSQGEWGGEVHRDVGGQGVAGDSAVGDLGGPGVDAGHAHDPTGWDQAPLRRSGRRGERLMRTLTNTAVPQHASGVRAIEVPSTDTDLSGLVCSVGRARQIRLGVFEWT